MKDWDIKDTIAQTITRDPRKRFDARLRVLEEQLSDRRQCHLCPWDNRMVTKPLLGHD